MAVSSRNSRISALTPRMENPANYPSIITGIERQDHVSPSALSSVLHTAFTLRSIPPAMRPMQGSGWSRLLRMARISSPKSRTPATHMSFSMRPKMRPGKKPGRMQTPAAVYCLTTALSYDDYNAIPSCLASIRNRALLTENRLLKSLLLRVNSLLKTRP